MAEKAVLSVKLADWKQKPLRKISHCAGRVSVYVHPSLYRALKLVPSQDVSRITVDGRLTTELGTGSLGIYGDSLVRWFFRLVGWLAEGEFRQRSKRNQDKSNFGLRFLSC